VGGAAVSAPLARERALGYFAVAVAFLQIVFGAIVRITGSGMGCGDHWPKCLDQWFPPFDRPDLIIEVTHRYLALAVSLAVIALLVAAIMRRRAGGPNLVRPAVLATVLVLAAALLGAVTVKMTLAAPVVVIHKLLALALLATLAWFTLRAGGFGAAVTSAGPPITDRSRRGAFAAAAMALVVIALGAFTANVAGAAGSCVGFPHCREILYGGTPLWLHIAHRVLAFAFLGHSIGLFVGIRRRGDHATLRRTALILLVLVVVQLLIAAAMVEMQFPAVVRSLHQAVGSGIWLAAFILAGLARSPLRMTPQVA
jgi:heme A synthase